MNPTKMLVITIMASLFLAGCNQKSADTTNVQKNTQELSASVAPTLKPSASPENKDVAEVESISAEFNTIDSAKDFPDFSETDLQQ